MHRSYANDDITVFWDSDKCRHARECVTGCPKVFKFGRKPWVILENGDNKDIWTAVKKCPSGALDIIYNHGIRIEYDDVNNCSRAYDGDTQVGECDYDANGGACHIYHTEVLSEYGGKGIAKRLVFRLVEEAERRGMDIIPTCSYAAKVLK